jgi:hypothetical protein
MPVGTQTTAVPPSGLDPIVSTTAQRMDRKAIFPEKIETDEKLTAVIQLNKTSFCPVRSQRHLFAISTLLDVAFPPATIAVLARRAWGTESEDVVQSGAGMNGGSGAGATIAGRFPSCEAK